MRCTLVDTGPLVALLDERDGARDRALTSLRVAPKPLLVCPQVITEALHLLHAHPIYVGRLAATVADGTLDLGAAIPWPRLSSATFTWMAKFAEHHPDFTDAFLVAWHEVEAGSRVWTFDSEFRKIWRTSKGKRIKLVGE